ncbi:MAG: S1C family serine protease [Planctomycetaceae bacterium]
MRDFLGKRETYTKFATAVFLGRGAIPRVVGLGILASGLLAILPSHGSTGGVLQAQDIVTALRPVSRVGEIETAIDVPPSLQEIYQDGGVPQSLEQLLDMERQQQRVANRVSACTVNVAIGPAQGCGVIVTSSGYILTAAHVGMRPGKTALITFSDGRTVTATTLGMKREVDAGLMKINEGQNNGVPWPHATLGRSESLRPGMWCIASGHPGGYERDRGPVTRVGRILKVRPDSIVTDCALIGGDSGGPLFDLSGRLIAVHSRIGNDVADNLHIAVEHYDASWDRLAKGEAWGYLEGFRPILGVSKDVTSSDARIGVVKTGSPAEQAGIQVGDVIEQFGDVSIESFQALTLAVADTMPGERVPCWINRGGDRIRITVEIGRDE